jgi:hypothetical protein
VAGSIILNGFYKDLHIINCLTIMIFGYLLLLMQVSSIFIALWIETTISQRRETKVHHCPVVAKCNMGGLPAVIQNPLSKVIYKGRIRIQKPGNQSRIFK